MNLFKFRKKKIEPSRPTIEDDGEKGVSVVTLLREIVAGDIFLKETIQRQYLYVLMLFALSMLYVNNRFLYERELRELSQLQTEMEDLKYRSLTLSKKMKQAGRRTMILEALKASESDLESAEEPLVIIK